MKLKLGRAGEDGAGASGRQEQLISGPSAQAQLPVPVPPAAAQGGEEEAKAAAVVPPPRFPATVRAAASLQRAAAAAGAPHATARRDDRSPSRPVVVGFCEREPSSRAAATTAPASDACPSLLSGGLGWVDDR